MIKQPDFQKIFYNHYGGKIPRKINYEIREDSNRYHDLVFLNSFIHDARFKRNKILLHGKKILIPIERDCWELPSVEHSKTSAEMYLTLSNLIISPALSLKWKFNHRIEFTANTELWIQEIKIERLSYDDLTIQIIGFDWECDIETNDNNLKIKLIDLKIPYILMKKK